MCTGSFAAAAISATQTLSELVPVGVEAVLAAFRTGMRSLVMRNDIERPCNTTLQSWSAVIGAQEAQAIQIIDTFNSNKVRELCPVAKMLSLNSNAEVILKLKTLPERRRAKECDNQWPSQYTQRIAKLDFV